MSFAHSTNYVGRYMISFTVDAVIGTALSLLMLKYMLEPLASKVSFNCVLLEDFQFCLAVEMEAID